MVSSFNRSLSARRIHPALNSPRLALAPFPRKHLWISKPFSAAILIWPLSVFLALGFVYLFVSPNFRDAATSLRSTSGAAASNCDVSDGEWVPDETCPLYNSSECPFAERGFNCLANGREDREYLKWRWKPRHCEIPRFDPREALERLRGKRVVFVGDSMSRTQWESLICMLMEGMEDKKSVYEVNGNRITKQTRFLAARFASYNLTIEFFRSVFLVQEGRPARYSPKRVKSVLKLDVLDEIHTRWLDSDVLVFNSGQWWVPGKLFNAGLYFQVNGTLKLGMPITSAFTTALSTWALWAEAMIKTSRTQIFFRTYEPSHWSNGATHSCTVTQYPLKEPKENNRSLISDIVTDIIGKMKVPVTILHVTRMGAYRSDAHVGRYSDMPSPDCSHWCLPGVPDAWNELMFSYIFQKHGS